MTNPETNEIAIGLRLIGMAARIHLHEPPEAMAREAQAAKLELESCAPGALRDYAKDVAERLIAFATAAAPEARETAEYALADAVERVNGIAGALFERAQAERAAA